VTAHKGGEEKHVGGESKRKEKAREEKRELVLDILYV